MSDLRLYNYKNNKLSKKIKLDKQNLKAFIETNAFSLLGLRAVVLNFALLGNNYDLLDLYYDEDYQLVVVEYRTDRFSSPINKALRYLDFITKNQGKMTSLLNEKLGNEIASQINLSGRIISIGNDFNEYDQYAIKNLPYMVDLIKFQVFEKDLFLLEKTYQSKKIVGSNGIGFSSSNDEKLFRGISEFILSLGDEVCEVHNKGFISYRKIVNFIYLFNDNGINLKLKTNNTYKTIVIKTFKSFEKYKNVIEKCYDES